MMPVYMDSYPGQINQVPFPQFYYPSYDGIRPHMIGDQAKSTVTYESWPNGNHAGTSIPYHACCSHGNFPGYYGFRPPVSYFPPSPPFHGCGHHPFFSERYPVNYSLPPHHSMEQCMYEYDRDAYRDYHCCGCPNHVCNQKSNKGVKIEEQEHDTPRKSDTVVPAEAKNYPYPVVWIPPQYVKRNKEYEKPFGSEVADQEKVPSNENMKCSESEPKLWNGWFPLDLNSLKSLMQAEDQRSTQNQQMEDKMGRFSDPVMLMPSNGKQQQTKDQRKMYEWFPLDINGLRPLMQGEEGNRRQNQQNEEQTRQFPFPIIWMPSNSEQGMAEKEKNAARATEKPHSTFKFIPMEPTESVDTLNIFDKNKSESSGQVKSVQVENTGTQNLVPVKKVEVQTKEHNSRSEKKARDVQSKNSESVSADNPHGIGVKRSPSPPKTSKLPPVCLRVEPLPNKKNGNGSSRFPSSPGVKERSKGNSRVSASSSSKENSLQDSRAPNDSMEKSEEVGPAEGDMKVVGVVDGKTNENRNNVCSGSQMKNSVELPIDRQEDVPNNSSAQSTREDGDVCKLKELEGVKCEKGMMSKVPAEANKAIHSTALADGECGKRMKRLSDVEAALLIQSAYRGFGVRKLGPLKKLKQMDQVREQMGEVRKRVEALESSSDLQKSNREKDMIGEMIMRLLLKLDTIQGLHPSLRDIRKGLAKELVTLQEKLDALMTEQFTDKAADNPSNKTRGDLSVKEIQSKSENSAHSKNLEEQDESHLSHTVDLVGNTQRQGMSDSEGPLDDKEVHGGCENECRELLLASGVDSQVAESARNMEVEDKAAKVESNVTDVVKTEIPESPCLEQAVERPLVPEEKITSEAERTSEELMAEQSQDLSYDQAGRRDEGKDARANGGIHTNEDEAKDAGVDGAMNVEDNLEDNGLRELPLKFIEEAAAVSKLDNSELVGEGTNEAVDGVSMLTTPCSHAEVEVDGKILTTKEAETDLSLELPVGVIEEEGAVSAPGKHERIEIVKDEDLSCEEAGYNLETNTITPKDSEDLLKIMVEDLPGNAAFEAEEIQPFSSRAEEGKSGKTGIDEERGHRMTDVDSSPSLESVVMDATNQEFEETKEIEQEHEANGKKEEEGHIMTDADGSPSLESVVVDATNQEFEETKEIEKEHEADGKEEEVSERKPQRKQPERVIDNDELDLPSESESTKEDVPVDTRTPQMSIDEDVMVMERDKKLLEENARLREIMEKLMEAGKEQLTVISNLTGRVKDLERKLSKKTKQRTRRCKKTPLATPKKPLDDAMKERAIEIAM